MIVCLCRGVSDGKVRLAVREGASTLKEVAARCAAGRGCGACHEQIHELIQAHAPIAAADDCAGHCPTSRETILSSGSIGEGTG